jgi:hypothetical protein
MDKTHKTIYLKIEEQEANIDELMIPIIQKLWENNIRTLSCCQEIEKDFAHISFESSQDAINFIKLVFGKKITSNLTSNKVNMILENNPFSYIIADKLLLMSIKDLSEIMSETTVDEKTNYILNVEKFKASIISSFEEDSVCYSLLNWGSNGFKWTCALDYNLNFIIHLNFPKDKITAIAKQLSVN